jgi:hypothetical protein
MQWAILDSNPRLTACKADHSTAELIARGESDMMVPTLMEEPKSIQLPHLDSNQEPQS